MPQDLIIIKNNIFVCERTVAVIFDSYCKPVASVEHGCSGSIRCMGFATSITNIEYTLHCIVVYYL